MAFGRISGTKTIEYWKSIGLVIILEISALLPKIILSPSIRGSPVERHGGEGRGSAKQPRPSEKGTDLRVKNV